MTESAYVRGDGNDVIGSRLVEEPWVRVADADCADLRPQEVPHHLELLRRAQPLLCLLTCDGGRGGVGGFEFGWGCLGLSSVREGNDWV
ncbi:hypothetical protein TIFTF001_010960 [Ficus carica]|uniref:Uncharacterized protein n=1 Tax=Ficus carica TaxID=3494 RepID=A0AA87ZSL4_FICCA|nr:hypothetical protein TIFTF001_010960 [Ficus carica]